MLKLDNKGKAVEELQMKLTHASLGAHPLGIDGDFGGMTLQAVKRFQYAANLVVDGIVGKKTWAALNDVTKDKFFVSIHGGHGGIHPVTNLYATDPRVGKRYQHPSLKLHTDDGWFYEGVENRIIANDVAERLRTLGIFALVTHHPFKCDYGKLGTHRFKTAPYVLNGYSGYTHSFHSNAISTSNNKEKLDATQGGYVFTTKGTTLSDTIAKELLTLWQDRWGDWVRLRDRKNEPTINSDAEANFQVLRQIEQLNSKRFGAILEEFGFFTSETDTIFITDEDTRQQRIFCAVELALRIKNMLL
jgi:hypothetical protein